VLTIEPKVYDDGNEREALGWDHAWCLNMSVYLIHAVNAWCLKMSVCLIHHAVNARCFKDVCLIRAVNAWCLKMSVCLIHHAVNAGVLKMSV